MSNLINYPVIKDFKDKLTKKIYRVGSFYQCDDPERIVMLQKRGFLDPNINPFEEKQEETEGDSEQESPVTDESELIQHGGGYFELPNGERVRGKEKALEALAALKGGE